MRADRSLPTAKATAVSENDAEGEDDDEEQRLDAFGRWLESGGADSD